MAGYRKQAYLAPLFKLFETITIIIIPQIIASMIDVGVANRDIKYIAIMGSVVIGLNIIGLIMGVVCQKLASIAAAGYASNIRRDMYAHINTFSHAELDKFSTASINNRVTHDVNRVQTAMAMLIRMVMRTPLLLIGSIVMSMLIDLQLSILFLIVSPLILGVIFIILKITDPLYFKTQQDLDRVSEITRENLQGARVIRAFNKQTYEERKFVASAKKLRKSGIKVVDVSSLLNPITFTIINFAIIAVLWFGGIRVNVGGLTQGQIIAFINYLTEITSALVSLSNIIIAFIKAYTCAGRINEILETKPSVTDKETTIFVQSAQSTNVPKIQFKHVYFSYGNGTNYAIRDLNIDIMPGETVGVIGGTGSGKTSIVNLIPRFYDTTKGKVLVDGVDVKDYKMSDLRAKIGLVPQQAVLFRGTLKDNLLWRKPNATLNELNKAVKISQSEEFVNELPNKYDYAIQAGGKNFSGGQRQRLTIARALVGDPEILILDDSASALDFATDANLRHAINIEIKDSTIILVSQRANTIKNADKIIVLDHGNIVGVGKHNDLLKTCNVYKEIYDSQTK